MPLALKLKQPPKNMKVVVAIAAGLIAFAALGFLVLISPQRSKAADLQQEIEATQQQLAIAQLASRARPADPRVDDLFRLKKAMPAGSDMAGILLELSRVADETGISFNSITPGPPLPGSGFQTLPIELTFQGNYYELSDFLFRLRTLVAKRDGRLDVGGRLYSVDNVDFALGNGSTLQAKLSTKAYIYAPAAEAAAAAPAPVAPPPGGTG